MSKNIESLAHLKLINIISQLQLKIYEMKTKSEFE